nr:hypothetical protein [uncultured Duncaniella sp.]
MNIPSFTAYNGLITFAVTTPLILCQHRTPFEHIPNINEKISAMIQKYRAETIDIEDVEFEEVDLEFDVLFPDLKQQGNDYDNQTEND